MLLESHPYLIEVAAAGCLGWRRHPGCGVFLFHRPERGAGETKKWLRLHAGGGPPGGGGTPPPGGALAYRLLPKPFHSVFTPRPTGENLRRQNSNAQYPQA